MSDDSYLNMLGAQVLEAEQNAANLHEECARIDLEAAKKRLLAAELDAERAAMALEHERLRAP